MHKPAKRHPASGEKTASAVNKEDLRIFSLYRDFFGFLDKIPADPKPRAKKWPLYLSAYYRPNRAFLDVYYSQSLLSDKTVLKGRVESVKLQDYAWLVDLCRQTPPEPIIAEAYEKCARLVPPPQRPEVHLLIGFFSPEGFVMHFRGRPVICYGLERFRDFRLLHVFFAHEYVHYLLNLGRANIPEQHSARWLLVTEGLATVFPTLVFPELELADSFLFRPGELSWCRDNEPFLRDVFCRGHYADRDLIGFYYRGNTQLGLPPRAGKYLGYQAVKNHLASHPEASLSSLLLDKRAVLSIDLCASGPKEDVPPPTGTPPGGPPADGPAS